MLRSRLTRWSIGTSLGLGLLWACLYMTPAHAGLDQLWFLGSDSNGEPNGRNGNNGIYNGGPPLNANIVNMKDYHCVDAEGMTAANGTAVIAYQCANIYGFPNPWNQRWRANSDPSSGWCGREVDKFVYHGVTYVAPDACANNNRDFNMWFSIAVGDNWGACVDVPGRNDANGQPLQIFECNGTPAQVWRVGNPSYGESRFWIRSNITGQGTNRCWTNWGNLVLYDCAYDF